MEQNNHPPQGGLDPDTLRAMIMEIIRKHEQTKGRGLYQFEIYQEIIKQGHKILIFILIEEIAALYQQEQIYANNEVTMYSSFKINDDYDTKSEKFNRKHPHYKLDDKLKVRATDAARVINLQKLKEILLSKEDLTEENSWMFEGCAKYLDQESLNGENIALTTYPRVGNTFLRKYLEMVTGVATGSDMLIDLNLSFQMNGFKGEGVTDDSIWIMKSHHPFLIYKSYNASASKAICCVRNPLDCLVSFLSLQITVLQTYTCPLDFVKAHYEEFKSHITFLIGTFRKYHEMLIEQCKENNVPLLFVRYEDLVAEPKPVIEDMFRFILEVENIEGTILEKQIEKVLNKGHEATLEYKNGPVKLNKYASYYDEELLATVSDELNSLIYYFGYCDSKSSSQKNPFNFIAISEDNLPKDVEFEGFKKDNAAILKTLAENKGKVAAKDNQLQLNEQSKGFRPKGLSDELMLDVILD